MLSVFTAGVKKSLFDGDHKAFATTIPDDTFEVLSSITYFSSVS